MFDFYTFIGNLIPRELLLTPTLINHGLISILFDDFTFKLSTLATPLKRYTPNSFELITISFSTIDLVFHLIIYPLGLKLTLECYGPIPHL